MKASRLANAPQHIVAMHSLQSCIGSRNMMSVTREVGTLTSIGPKRHAHRACHKRQVTQASYNKQGEDSLRVDGKVTRLWKVFFKPGSGYTDRLGVAIPMGDALDERTEEQRWEARQEAARAAVNIDREERQRRLVFGTILLAVTAAIIFALVEKRAGPLERLWGMQTVPDFKLSKKIRKKVLTFVASGAVATILLVGAFCAYPL